MEQSDGRSAVDQIEYRPHYVRRVVRGQIPAISAHACIGSDDGALAGGGVEHGGGMLFAEKTRTAAAAVEDARVEQQAPVAGHLGGVKYVRVGRRHRRRPRHLRDECGPTAVDPEYFGPQKLVGAPQSERAREIHLLPVIGAAQPRELRLCAGRYGRQEDGFQRPLPRAYACQCDPFLFKDPADGQLTYRRRLL